MITVNSVKYTSCEDTQNNALKAVIDGVTSVPDEVKNICNVVWTTDVKALYKAKLIADKTFE